MTSSLLTDDRQERADVVGPRLLASPEHCPGDYVLHAYCKYENPDHAFREFPWAITDCQTRGEAHTRLRKVGWIMHRDRTATCPKCAKALQGR